MFRKNKPFMVGSGQPIYTTVEKKSEVDGVNVVQVATVRLSDVKPELPPLETFSLENVLEAGVPLKQVNSKVLNPSDPVTLGQVETLITAALDKRDGDAAAKTD